MLLAVAAAAVAIVGGAIAAVVLLTGGSGGNSGSSGNVGSSPNSYNATGPWRLQIRNDIQKYASCRVTLTETHSATPILQTDSLYKTSTFQIYQTGFFRWRANDLGCKVAAIPGSGTFTLPFAWDQADDGDTPAFVAPPQGVAVQVTDYHGGQRCDFTLYNPANGQKLDIKTATQGKGNDTVTLDTLGIQKVYLEVSDCRVLVKSAGR